MHTKLTLRIDEELIRVAKVYSKRTEKSLSQIVADYLALITAKPSGDAATVTPLVRSLRGALKGAALNEADYRRHLEEKYL